MRYFIMLIAFFVFMVVYYAAIIMDAFNFFRRSIFSTKKP